MLIIKSSIMLLISIIIMKLSMMLSMKMKIDNEKMSPFECGFNPISNSRIPFSLRFFLITIIFLIFDIEISLILPMIPSMMTSSTFIWSITLTLIMLILLLGTYFEWMKGALNWM